MTADLTREQAREQVARALYIAPRINPADAAERWDRLQAGDDTRSDYLDDADAALTVLWPVVEGLRAELAHAHTVIARHVEPLRKPCRPELGDCCDGSAHTWQPAQGSRLPDCGPAAAPVAEQGSGRVEMRGRAERG